MSLLFVHTHTLTEDPTDGHVILAMESDLKNSPVNYSNAGTRAVTAASLTDISLSK